MTMRIEIVTAPGRLAEIGPAWDALWAGGDGSVFQSHGWVSTWWRSRRRNDRQRLCVALGWAGERLAVVMPFATRWHRGVRVLEWAAKDCSDYCDALVDPEVENRRQLLEQVWAAVSASGPFDVAYLSHVRPDAAISPLFNGWQRSPKLTPGRRTARSLQVQSHGANGHAWFRGLNKKARNNHTRGLRIVGEAGPVAVRVGEPGELPGPVLDRMIELKQQWLVATGQSNKLLEDGAAALRALVEELGRQKALRVFTIHCGDRLVAGSLNIVTSTRMQAFFATYDPDFDRASPGTLVMVEYLIWAFDRGMAEVDFLCGEEEYKFKFANAEVDLLSFTGARTLLGRVALAVGERLDSRRDAAPRAGSAGPVEVAEA